MIKVCVYHLAKVFSFVSYEYYLIGIKISYILHKIVKNGLLFLNYFMANDFFDDGICGGGSM